MMIQTTVGTAIDSAIVQKYFQSLVGYFFKILPIREKEESTLPVYMRSLQSELIGCKELIVDIQEEASFITLLSILQFLIDTPDCSIKDVKREVFKAISICNKLSDKYSGGGQHE